MPQAQLNKALFVASMLLAASTMAISVAGALLYLILYLGAFVVLVPDNHEDQVQYWDEHADKNMFTVFICVEMCITRVWALYECFRVLRTEALGSAIEQRNWALTCMWIAVSFAICIDIVSHYFIYSMPEHCNNIGAFDSRKQRSFASLCAQSNQNQVLVHAIHYINAAMMCTTAALVTVDTLAQIKEVKDKSRVLEIIKEEYAHKHNK